MVYTRHADGRLVKPLTFFIKVYSMLLAQIFRPHAPSLTVLFIALTICASFIALEFAERINVIKGSARCAWITAAGIAMGGGIWSMHFLATIAVEPFTIAFHPSGNALSLLIAILIATAGLYTVFWHQESSHRFAVGGTILGLGI